MSSNTSQLYYKVDHHYKEQSLQSLRLDLDQLDSLIDMYMEDMLEMILNYFFYSKNAQFSFES